MLQPKKYDFEMYEQHTCRPFIRDILNGKRDHVTRISVGSWDYKEGHSIHMHTLKSRKFTESNFFSKYKL